MARAGNRVVLDSEDAPEGSYIENKATGHRTYQKTVCISLTSGLCQTLQLGQLFTGRDTHKRFSHKARN
eukprot:8163621-Karenia_brevis.AAC.1